MMEYPRLTESELIAMLARPMFGDPLGPWCLWFAWHPVKTVDGRWTWLRHIWRRRFQTKAHLPGPTFNWWIYARTDGYSVQSAATPIRGNPNQSPPPSAKP